MKINKILSFLIFSYTPRTAVRKTAIRNRDDEKPKEKQQNTHTHTHTHTHTQTTVNLRAPIVFLIAVRGGVLN